MKYWKITIEVDRVNLEGLLGRLMEAGYDSVQVEDNADVADILNKQHEYDYDVVDESLLHLDPAEDPRVTLYVEREEPLHPLEEAVFAIEGASMEKEEVDDSDWQDAYKKHFTITPLAGDLLIVPSWERDLYDEGIDTLYKGKHPLFMDPGAAFGTGEHPTTAMCVELLAKTGCMEKKVLDVGTGSGILALAAARLGAEQVLAIDIDPVAVTAAKENVEENGLSHLIKVREGDLLQGVDFTADVVVANLFAEIIKRLAPSVKGCLKPAGVLIVTGILLDKEKGVIESLSKEGFALLDRREEGEWVALAVTGEGL